MMRILICDDETPYVNMLRLHIDQYMQDRGIDCRIVATSDPLEAALFQDTFDLAFLDIQMESLDGINLARKLKAQNQRLALFFITNYEGYLDEAMDLKAMRYLTKPLDIDRLHSGLDKAMEYLDHTYVDVYVLQKDGTQRIPIDEILYVTIDGRKTCLKTSAESYYVQDKFTDFCQTLPSFFYLVHKSFSVNLHYVQRYTYSLLTLTNGEEISVAPRRRSAFHKYWFAYLRRH